MLGIAAEGFDQAFDAAIHGGGEEERLALFGEGIENDLHVFAEAHVEHAVGFVEDAELDAICSEGAASEVIHDASWSADDDMSAFL